MTLDKFGNFLLPHRAQKIMAQDMDLSIIVYLMLFVLSLFSTAVLLHYWLTATSIMDALCAQFMCVYVCIIYVKQTCSHVP